MRGGWWPSGFRWGRPPVSAPARAAAALVAVALLAGAACGSNSAQGEAAVLERSAGGMTARLIMSPEPAAAMKPLRLSVALGDASGRPAAGRDVAFDLSMPSMTMAPNRPQVSEVGDGTYEATAMLSMAGQWQLTVEVDTPGQPLKISFTFAAD